MYRTITLRLNHRFEEDKPKLLETMEAFAQAYNMSAEYGFEKKEGNKIRNSMAMYHKIRKAIPGLPGAMVQTACFMATEISERYGVQGHAEEIADLMHQIHMEGGERLS